MTDQIHVLARPYATGARADASLRDDDTADPAERVRAARARLMDRLHQLERRITKTKESLDVVSRIRQQPLAAAGIAVAVGALIGLSGGRGSRSPLASKFAAMLTALAVQVAKTRLQSWALDKVSDRVDAAMS